jgi:threonine synthase
MKFVSVNKQSPAVSFREALLNGIAPDRGLYVPEAFPKLDATLFAADKRQSLHTLGAEILSAFIDEIPREELAAIVERAWDFPIPLTKLGDDIFLLELFHGPTLAFKDVGARFMARAMSYLLAQEQRDLTIIVATSGDTGSAVAHGFFNVSRINVFVLYPSGRISRLQEQQMTTLGGNITAVEIDGTFDDCQRLVKRALVDQQLQHRGTLTTANSINLGRLLPQIVYYAWALVQLRENFATNDEPVVVVPSGNFGNITAAAYAKRIGVPLRNFVAATNANDGVLQYLHSGIFVPRPSIQTYSNAMDVGNPSNLARLHSLYENDLPMLKHEIDAVSISDKETLKEIKQTYDRTGKILDPHTAVGVAAARKAREWMTNTPPVIVAATAHPAKFLDVVEKAIKVEIPLPEPLATAVDHPKHTIKLRAHYDDWKQFLLSQS